MGEEDESASDLDVVLPVLVENSIPIQEDGWPHTLPAVFHQQPRYGLGSKVRVQTRPMITPPARAMVRPR